MIRLFDIAYVSRHSLPLLLSVAFMLADVHFRVELEVRFEARFLQNENREDRQRHRNNFNHFFCLIFFTIQFFHKVVRIWSIILSFKRLERVPNFCFMTHYELET